LQYSTPTMSGFDGGVGIVLSGDNATQASYQARVNYANGPIAAGANLETKRDAAKRTAYAIAGSYDFGAAKVSAGYVVSEAETVSYVATNGTVQGGKGFHLGVKAPLGAAYVGAQYAKNTTSKDTAIEGFAGYNLSKRTSVYLDAVRVNFNADSRADVTKYGVGVLHAF
jgi:predicted porin